MEEMSECESEEAEDTGKGAPPTSLFWKRLSWMARTRGSVRIFISVYAGMPILGRGSGMANRPTGATASRGGWGERREKAEEGGVVGYDGVSGERVPGVLLNSAASEVISEAVIWGNSGVEEGRDASGVSFCSSFFSSSSVDEGWTMPGCSELAGVGGAAEVGGREGEPGVGDGGSASSSEA